MKYGWHEGRAMHAGSRKDCASCEAASPAALDCRLGDEGCDTHNADWLPYKARCEAASLTALDVTTLTAAIDDALNAMDDEWTTDELAELILARLTEQDASPSEGQK